MKYLFLIFFIALTAISYAQSDAPVIAAPPARDEDKVFIVVEQMPTFPGGEDAMSGFISHNIKYPDFERENDIQGRVVVSFIVEKDGALSNITIKKGVSPGIDKEALRVVKALPKFRPGKQQGVAVRVEYVIPIMFKLASPEPAKDKKQ